MASQESNSKAVVYLGSRAVETSSQAELDLRSAFEEQLGNEFSVIHSVGWYGKGRRTVGQADFLLIHPTHGILVVEVKGGKVSFERIHGESKWRTENRFGYIDDIEDPCFQADRNRWALSDWLAQDRRTSKFAYAIFPAIALPESYAPKDIRPDCPADVVIDITHLNKLRQRVLGIFKYWETHADRKNQKMDGASAVAALIELCVPTGHLNPRLADYFERERCKIEALTKEQGEILNILSFQKTAAITGGAGTGKTMLAMQKATELAQSGYRVLFVCYNNRLANWVNRAFSEDKTNVDVYTYHQLTSKVRGWAGLPTKMKEPKVFYDRPYDFLQEGADILRPADAKNHEKLFDAIIVDEGQDFPDTWWLPLTDLYNQPDDPVLYAFLDDNQKLSTQLSNIPFEATRRYPLHRNCRNTQRIHNALMPYRTSDMSTAALGPEGRDIECIPAITHVDARHELGRVLLRLTRDEGIHLDQIMILTPVKEKSQWRESEQVGSFTITWKTDVESINAVRVSTISSFKGLESEIVILTEMDKVWRESSNELVYVGLSRARNHVIVIGALPAPTTAEA